MRNTIIILFISLFAVSCGKDKFTSAPQISFKSIKPNRTSSNIIIGSSDIPILTLGITDKEGDLGNKGGDDVSYIYIKHLLLGRVDSFLLPDLQSVSTSNFQSDIIINTFDILRPGPATNRPRVDTLQFEIYVTDFAKNKSNVLTTEPLYYEIQ